MTSRLTLIHRPLEIKGGVLPSSTLRIGMPPVKLPAAKPASPPPSADKK